MLYRILIIDRYSHLYLYSSTSTRTRTRTNVIIKYSDSYSYSHVLQVLLLVLVLVNLVLAPALLKGTFPCVNILNSQKWPNYTVTISFKLSDCHWKLVEITLYTGTHDIRLLWKWHRYPALNGFQKAKSIQCYTRQIMSKLDQRKQISNKKGSLVN